MASGPTAEGETVGGDGDGAIGKQRWKEKVYTRKNSRGLISNSSNNESCGVAPNCNTVDLNNGITIVHEDSIQAAGPTEPHANFYRKQFPSLIDTTDRVVDDRDQPPCNGSAGSSCIEKSENRVKISLLSKSKKEIRELKIKLRTELDVIRSLVKKIDDKEQRNSTEFSQSRISVAVAGNDFAENFGTTVVHSEIASVCPPMAPRPFHKLSIPVPDNNHLVCDNVEKEKRTPKANQFYRKSEFLLGKDKFPPMESNKRPKLKGKKHETTDGFGFGFGMSKFFKSCTSLLDRMMKHKYGWVFNAPVDVEGHGLHDYFCIIRHPMDLGTVKSRLNKNWYKSPREFAEDVRLTFRNAMTYNPKGQDVHIMAEQLLKLFEDRWAAIDIDYSRELTLLMDYEMGIPTPTVRNTSGTTLPQPPESKRAFDRSDSMTIDPRTKSMSLTPSVRTPAPKKPKAKDPHKRDMTFDEKQKLSTNLQNLPSEKLDQIVQIIKKRNSALSQHDDEIEVDIDNVDAETLWELDRFVTNYKKSLSKSKRKAELAIQKTRDLMHNGPDKNSVQTMTDASRDKQSNDIIVSHSEPLQSEKRGEGSTSSTSSTSSSTGSGSSSSGSETESSSVDRSDAGHSPAT